MKSGEPWTGTSECWGHAESEEPVPKGRTEPAPDRRPISLDPQTLEGMTVRGDHPGFGIGQRPVQVELHHFR